MFEEIEKFLIERKEAKAKKEIKPNTSEAEKQKILQKLDEEFSLKIWAPKAAKRAGQLSMVSHPAKFSHPDAKSTSILVEDNQSNTTNKPYFYSGNLKNLSVDTFGNAAALDVLKFLELKIKDGRSVLEHIEQESDEIKKLFLENEIKFEDIKNDFLKIKNNSSKNETDKRIKQVYFPVKNDYHLLSILTASPVVFGLKNRIDQMRFSDEAKQGKEAKINNQNHLGFPEFYDLTVIGYGGSKPQNISNLNSKNGGKAYLLPCFPPIFEEQKIRLPKTTFFGECVFFKEFRNEFKNWERLLRGKQNSFIIREARDNIVDFVVGRIVSRSLKIREQPVGWSKEEKYKELPKYQKIWLDDCFIEEREDKANREWLDELKSEMAAWIKDAYNENKKLIKLYSVDADYIKNYIIDPIDYLLL